jgi:fructose-1,6-bisphosphatase/inositol monophosphatase family enzyme
MPVTGEIYWGTREEAFHNGHRLVPLTNVDLNSPLAFIAVPSNAHLHFEISFPRLRSLGSVTAHLAYVAHGKGTAAVTRQMRLWDIAALLPSLNISQTQLVYLSGKTFDSTELLDGSLTPEPLIAAHFSIIEKVRTCIRAKTNG